MSKFTIKVNTIWLAVITLLLLLPDDFFSMAGIYYSGNTSSIMYKWLDYHFNVVQLIIIVIGACAALLRKNRAVLYIGICLAVREALCFLGEENSLFLASAYEMYLTLFVGVSLILWSLCVTKSEEEASHFYEIFLLLNIFTVYIMALKDGASGILDDRFNASNLDVGSTGCLCCIGLIFMYYKRPAKHNLLSKPNKHIILSKLNMHKILTIIAIAIALYLSGSRINLALALLITVAIVMTSWGEGIKGNRSKVSKNAFFLALAIIVISVGILIMKGDEVISMITNSRYATLLSPSAIQSDGSIIGRSASIQVGLDVLKNHPFGISGYFINLQTEIRARGFATFPHCGVLSAYLIYGPITLVLYVFWIWLAFKMYRIEKKYAWTLIFLLVYNLVAGGPIVNFKIIYMFGMPTVLAWQKLKTVENGYGRQFYKSNKGYCDKEVLCHVSKKE